MSRIDPQNRLSGRTSCVQDNIKVKLDIRLYQNLNIIGTDYSFTTIRQQNNILIYECVWRYISLYKANTQ